MHERKTRTARQTSQDDRQKQMAIGYLTDSDDLIKLKLLYKGKKYSTCTCIDLTICNNLSDIFFWRVLQFQNVPVGVKLFFNAPDLGLKRSCLC